MAFDSPFDGLALSRSVENSRVLKSLARPVGMPASVLTYLIYSDLEGWTAQGSIKDSLA